MMNQKQKHMKMLGNPQAFQPFEELKTPFNT